MAIRRVKFFDTFDTDDAKIFYRMILDDSTAWLNKLLQNNIHVVVRSFKLCKNFSRV